MNEMQWEKCHTNKMLCMFVKVAAYASWVEKESNCGHSVRRKPNDSGKITLKCTEKSKE